MKKLMIIAVIFVFAASCTPESLSTDEQQIDKKDYWVPPNG